MLKKSLLCIIKIFKYFATHRWDVNYFNDQNHFSLWNWHRCLHVISLHTISCYSSPLQSSHFDNAELKLHSYGLYNNYFHIVCSVKKNTIISFSEHHISTHLFPLPSLSPFFFFLFFFYLFQYVIFSIFFSSILYLPVALPLFLSFKSSFIFSEYLSHLVLLLLSRSFFLYLYVSFYLSQHADSV